MEKETIEKLFDGLPDTIAISEADIFIEVVKALSALKLSTNLMEPKRALEVIPSVVAHELQFIKSKTAKKYVCIGVNYYVEKLKNGS